MRTEYLFILIVFVLQILSVIGQDTQITISTTTTPYTNLPPESNTAEILILSLNVTLEANITGMWERPGKTYSHDKSINFDVFTVDLAGSYKFYADGIRTVSIQIDISATGSNFAEMTSSGVYTILSDNNVFYNDRTLVCATSDTSTEPEWSRNGAVITGTWDDVTGISTLDITISQQGYYTCTPVSGTSYTVAIFNPDITIIAQGGVTYYYTKDIDPSNIQLLCTTTDLTKALESIDWTIPGQTNRNPVLLEELPNSITQLNCSAGLVTAKLRIQGPPVITLSTTPDITYSMLPTASEANNADIMALSKNVTLGINLVGEWKFPNGSRSQSNPLVLELFTANLAGVYEFYITDWNGVDILAIQITLSAMPYFAELSQGEYTLLSGNNVFYHDTTLVCGSSDTSTKPEWRRDREVITGIWDPITGISTLDITTSQQGYYTCTPASGTSYTVAIFNPDITIIAKDEGIYFYTQDVDPIDIQLLCTTTDFSIALNNIKWMNGGTMYNNPAILNDIQNTFTTLTCNTGNIQVNLMLQGPPILTVSYPSLTTPYSTSVSSTYSITILTQDVTITSNLMGTWQSVVSSPASNIAIQVGTFTKDKAGLYSVYVTPWDGTSDIPAIQLDISAIGNNFAEMTSSGVYNFLTGFEVFYVDTTLICATSDSTEPQWSYIGIPSGNNTPSGVWNSDTGLSTLNIQTTAQGYYKCNKGALFSASIFDPSITTVVKQGEVYTYSYTKGVDSSDIQLFCTTSINRAFPNMKWGSFGNPVILNNVPNQEFDTFDCTFGPIGILSIDLLVQGPPVITLSTAPDTTYSMLPTASDNNRANIPVLSENVMLQTNLLGRWLKPDGSSTDGNFIEFILFTVDLVGIYQFNVTNWENQEEKAILINISAVGTAFITMTQNDSQIIYQELNNNSIINMTGNASLACATSHIPAEENDIEWFYQKTSIADPGAIRGDYNLTIGLNVLVTDQPGFYRCEVSNENREKFIYFVGIVPTSDDIQSIGRDDLETAKTIDYILGEPLMLYYYDVNIPITAIRWGVEVGSTELEEFLNPVDVNEVFAKFGSGAYKFRCFYRQSPITNVGNISLNMKVSLRIENQGLYSLRRNTSEGVEYTTAAFNLIVTGYIEQNIINLTPRYINDTSIQISWQLLISLPDNAEETFTVTYQTLNGVIQTAGITTELNYNLTDLIPGQTYTIWVELSYTYTFMSPKLSIEVTIPALDFPLIYVVIVVILIVIIVLLAITAVLIILLIWKLRKRKVKKFEVLETEEIPPEPSTKPSKDFGYSPVPIDNLAYNPELTESMGVKSKFKESARNSGNYQNLKEVMDPRMEPIALHLFKKAIDMLWKDETTLENEYKSLGGETLLYECGYAQLDQNRIKNKYKFIYPYDKSRVVLKKLGKAMHTDYINASNIPGVYVKENFIAAQGPKENTIKDFWRMVFELKIVNIVMVTNCVEGGKQKCEEYFPTKEGQISEFPPFKVRITNAVQSRGHITRIISIERGNEKFQVKHFHFTAWPDHDVPSLHHELLQFIGYVHENITQSDAPILVHCSAGVGRTGTFITLFNLRANILKQQPISVYHLVHEMREHRPHMVQTFRQYKFIYLAVLELLQEKTAVSAEEFLSTYQNYMESARIEESEFAKQFSELNYQCDKSFVYSSDKGEENADKNPVKDILPYDINRVMIYSPFFTCNYINATNHNDFFITTQHPCENTLRDFMQMIYETNAGLVVMLTTSKEKSKILGNLSERKAYWPHKDDTLEVPPFQVQVVNAEKTTAMIKQKISLKNVKENSEHEFLQVISATWNEKGEPIDYQCIINVVRFITVQRQKYPHSPIIIHCVDSIGKTGVVLTVYECIKEMQETGEIDIFHTVKRLRRERMKCIPHLSQFQACFTLMKQYLDY
ncbi:hypothetical protein LOD99_6037 [Oopsacas minuta]|uniref:protein-tyrosine-phosphatase n=1 Tax=Oopsacas minuta TaxID=111878 RepID=A0AAV7JPX2_9METZ|nr:hypothetical protein LOD99_6037 [Oopsacas minuta]